MVSAPPSDRSKGSTSSSGETPDRIDQCTPDLLKRSGGVMLNLTTILGHAANTAIDNGTERWSKARLQAAARLVGRPAGWKPNQNADQGQRR